MSDLKSKPRELLHELATDLSPLWASGLALLVVMLGSLLWKNVIGPYDEPYEWTIYLALGTIFPASLLLLTLARPVSGSKQSQLMSLALGGFCLLVSSVFLARGRQITALALAIVHLLLIVGFLRKEARLIRPSSILITFIVLAISWTVSASLLWWSPFGRWFLAGDNTAETIYRFAICLAALLLVFFTLKDPGATKEDRSFRLWTPAHAAAILLIGIASVRSDQLFNAMSYSHWSAVIGPAEMVRQGGWLLWDVPSQYGFLNTLLVAILPFKSVWQSAYLVNSTLLFLSAVFLFFILRSIRSGLRNFFFSLAITISAVFLMSGWPPALLGPQVFPGLGPFRFFWCYALLAILIWEFVGSKRSHFSVPIVGTVFWLMGSLWSSESAVYCAAIWLPAYTLIAIRRARVGPGDHGSRKKRLPRTVAWLAAPFLLLAMIVGAITIYYLWRLGHSPDWRAFFEYSLSFASGFFSMPIDPRGPVWALFLVFCGLSTTAVYFLRDGITQKAMPLIAGCWGALWAISSYYVSRSHANYVTTLSPIVCIAIGLTLYLFARSQRRDAWIRFIKMSYVPFLTVLLTVTFGNAGFLRLYLSSPQLGYQRNIDTHLPRLDPALLELFESAKVRPSDPVVYSAIRVKAIEPAADGLSHDHGVALPAWPTEGGELLSAPRTWLPTAPFVLFAPLPETRRQLYMERFTSRARLSGWLVQNKKELPYTSSPWFYEQLKRTHTPASVFENADWQVIWFELRVNE